MSINLVGPCKHAALALVMFPSLNFFMWFYVWVKRRNKSGCLLDHMGVTESLNALKNTQQSVTLFRHAEQLKFFCKLKYSI